MGLFGKILLVVNLLAACGFVYLNVQDYKGRQTINAAALRHIMLVNGLPLDGSRDPLPARVTASSDNYLDFTSTEIPFAIEGPGYVKTTTVSPELLYAYFNGAGDGGGDPLAGTTPVASQMGEVKRVWEIIKGLVDKAEGNAAKAKIAGDYLLYQAQTYTERSEYLNWIAKGDGGELTHALDIKFYRVLPDLLKTGQLNPDRWMNPKEITDLEQARDAANKAAQDAEAAGNVAEAEAKKAEAIEKELQIAWRKPQPPQDQTDRKRLAHLLIHLDLGAAWQKRTMMVLGIIDYTATLGSQSIAFKGITDRVVNLTIKDQERFVGQYAQLRQLAIERTHRVLEMSEIRAQLTAQAQRDQDLVNQRQLQLEDLTAQRAAFKNEVNTLMAKQTLVEKNLHEIEQKIALTLEDIYKLEAELRKKERDRYEQGKK